MTVFERNSEFDRPYWDDYSGDRWESTNQSRNKTVWCKYPGINISGNGSDDHKSTKRSRSLHVNRDSVSSLFVYPFSGTPLSTNTSAYTHANLMEGLAKDGDTRHHIKRSEYSEYNEQRIKFHLKF